MSLQIATVTTQRLDYGSVSAFDDMDDGTILTWCNIPTASTDQPLVSKLVPGGSSWRNFDVTDWPATGDFVLNIKRATTNLEARSSNAPISNGVWCFLGCTWDLNGSNGDQMLFHGTLTAQVAEVSSYQVQTVGSGSHATDAGGELTVGNYEEMPNWANASGHFAWVGVWDRILTLAEIQTQQWKMYPTSGCLAMNHVGFPGSDSLDYSGNGRDLTAVGSPSNTAHVPIEIDSLSRPWIVVPPPPPSSITGTANITLDDFTVTSTGELDIDGTANITLDDFTVSATGELDLDGSADITLDDFTLTSVGQLDIGGTLDTTLDDFTLTSTAELDIDGTADITLDDFTVTSIGELDIDGTLTVTLDDFTLTATGNSGNSGALNVTLDDFTLSSIGQLDIDGTANITLDDFTVTSAAALDIDGASNITLDDFTLSSTGILGTPPITGTLNVTLDDFTLSSTGELDIDAISVIVLDDFTLSSAGALAIDGTLNVTLDDMTLTAIGASGVISSYTVMAHVEIPLAPEQDVEIPLEVNANSEI